MAQVLQAELKSEPKSEGPAAFGVLLRRYRLAAGLTHEALAELATLSPRAISDLERGARRNPHRHTVDLLVRALGLTGADWAAMEAAVERKRGPAAPRAPNSTASVQLQVSLLDRARVAYESAGTLPEPPPDR